MRMCVGWEGDPGGRREVGGRDRMVARRKKARLMRMKIAAKLTRTTRPVDESEVMWSVKLVVQNDCEEVGGGMRRASMLDVVLWIRN